MTRAEPISQIAQWLQEAASKEAVEPAAMSVATVGADGRPSLRMVLLRGVDARGLVFYTNLGSRKARDIRANSWVALCLHWKSMSRQIRVEGRAELVSDTEADAYFATRARDSQIGAWASKQSHTLEGRFELEARVALFAAKFGIGAVPRPEFWSGYRVKPEHIEFWEDRLFRLHDRTQWDLHNGAWTSHKLYP
jgi:pyridoxamine 5'-phosphate oxidase